MDHHRLVERLWMVVWVMGAKSCPISPVFRFGSLLRVRPIRTIASLLQSKWTWHDMEVSDEYCSPRHVFHK